MTLQQIKYILAIAETNSITEAARRLFISQPSLSNALQDIEKELQAPLFIRRRNGVILTQFGQQFIGYARAVQQQVDLLEDNFINNRPSNIRFSVSTQHYTFTANAFVEMVKQFGEERFEFILNETQTYQILEDVKNRFSDLGVLYLSQSNEAVLRKEIEQRQLQFIPLFTTKPHVFLRKNHPLSTKSIVTLEDLKPYARLNFLQGPYESNYFSEELLSTLPTDKLIRISDRASVVNLLVGLDGYTISIGIMPSYLQGDVLIAIPLDYDESITIGYVKLKNQTLSELALLYIEALKTYENKH
ncbi:LysR family transcriptional regulator [uncultured Veillonella sp.]|uniref:LysR family transcriptional regulator n=1 Tax=uncultured Veillonella sp. TaxID=159268 RepID=UPI0025EBA44E|nr:LysR family transcriptional regulator [uncultured Veillonella sp.]MDY3974511.1 LysR family transcriptional regulator [Veillonella caviae]